MFLVVWRKAVSKKVHGGLELKKIEIIPNHVRNMFEKKETS